MPVFFTRLTNWAAKQGFSKLTRASLGQTSTGIAGVSRSFFCLLCEMAERPKNWRRDHFIAKYLMTHFLYSLLKTREAKKTSHMPRHMSYINKYQGNNSRYDVCFFIYFSLLVFIHDMVSQIKKTTRVWRHFVINHIHKQPIQSTVSPNILHGQMSQYHHIYQAYIAVLFVFSWGVLNQVLKTMLISFNL